MQVTANTEMKAVHDKNGCLYQNQNYPPPQNPKPYFFFVILRGSSKTKQDCIII